MCNLTKSFLKPAKSRFVFPELVLERRKEKVKRSLTQVHLPNFSSSKKLRGFEDAKVQKCRDANLNLQELREARSLCCLDNFSKISQGEKLVLLWLWDLKRIRKKHILLTKVAILTIPGLFSSPSARK